MKFLHIIQALFLFFVLQACGDEARDTTFAAERAVAPAHIPDSFIDPAAVTFVDQFFSDLIRYSRAYIMPERLRVIFVESSDFPKSEVGYCTRRWIERKISATRVNIHTVELSTKLLDRVLLLRHTIYHELGHCILDLPHVDSLSDSAIMAETVFENELYDETEWRRRVEQMLNRTESR